ncbi:MAG: hypothetical protein LBT39_10095, partial [Treponema sp.]|nr:hypothetical protein [Treponema sp.]
EADKGPAELTGLVCDRENLEILLRISRKKARPPVAERPAALLTPYLAIRQGLLPGRGLPERPPWKVLAGYAAPAALWETDILGPRQAGYTPETLDREIARGNLLWYGAGRERLGFCAPEDLALVFADDPALPFAGPDNAALGEASGAFWEAPRDFWEIKAALGEDTTATARRLWEEVWGGRLSADSFEPVRRGIAGGYVPREAPQAVDPRGRRQRRIPRALRERWRSGPPVPGRWFSLAGDGIGGEEPDPLDEEELNRDRVRMLLDRWGVLARPLLEREAPALSWARLLPTIRRLELAGELVAGRFFRGINSLQFASPSIPGELEAAEAVTGIYWMNALDPASPAGLDIEGLERRLPPRIASTRPCFRGRELIVVAGKNNGDLRVFLGPDDPDLPEALGFLKIPRPSPARRKISVETINGEAAPRSPYAGALKALGFLPDRDKLTRW